LAQVTAGGAWDEVRAEGKQLGRAVVVESRRTAAGAEPGEQRPCRGGVG